MDFLHPARNGRKAIVSTQLTDMPKADEAFDLVVGNLEVEMPADEAAQFPGNNPSCIPRYGYCA